MESDTVTACHWHRRGIQPQNLWRLHHSFRRGHGKRIAYMLQWGACGIISDFIRGDTEEKRIEWALRAALTLIIVDLLVAFCALFPSVSICFMFGHISFLCLLLGLKRFICGDQHLWLRNERIRKATTDSLWNAKVKIGKILIDQVGKERCTVLLLLCG